MSKVARLAIVAALAAAYVVGLLYGEWWTVPIVAAGYALLRRGADAPRQAMIGALIGVLVLLAVHASRPGFSRLLASLGAIFPVPGAVVLLLSLLLTMTIAYTSARVVTGVVGRSQ